MNQIVPERDSAPAYRTLFNLINQAIFVVSGETGIICDANPAAEALTGWCLSELRAMHHSQLHPSDEAERARKALAELVRAPAGVRNPQPQFEWNVLHRNGRIVPVDILGEVFPDSNGNPLVLGIFRDISDRRKGEEELRASELKYRRLFESIRDAVAAIDMAGYFVECNPAFEEMVGYSAGELRRRTYRDLTPERWHAPEEQILTGQVIANGHSEIYEKEYRRRDGTVFPVELHVFLLRNTEGQPIGMWAIVRDITERKRAEGALRASEERYRTILEAALDGFAAMDGEGRFCEVNDAYCRMTGYSREELLGMRIRELDATESVAETAARLQAVKASGADRFESRQRRKDGTILDVEISVQYRSAGDGFVAFLRDIRERKRNEEALLRSEEKFSTLFRSSPISITLSDLSDNDRFLEVNEAFENYTGHPRESVIGNTYPPDWLWADPDEYTQAVAQQTSGGQLNGFEFRFRRATGEIRNGQLWARIVDFGGKSCVLAMTVDVTERKHAEAERERLQQQLAHAQKMECVGRLAGGVAHDFNNLMGVILMHADSAIDQLNSADPVRDSISVIEDAAQKAAAIGRQLMTFSQKQVPQTELLDLNSVIAENYQMIRRLIGEDVQVVFNRGPAALVKADRGQLGQIIINLAVNSRDAMPQGGTFEIQTYRTDVEEGDHRLNPAGKPGSHVVLKVSDNGTGMDPETQSRAFEPFFTTKPVGKGTGLGLSVVYAIISQMGGTIEIESEARKGTEFRITLPVASETPKRIIETEEGPPLGGTETILLTEDEPAFREKLHELLKRAGYQVMVAANGSQAFHLSVEETAPIHLLLTDIVMPEMSGYRLAERLLSLRPQTKVLYMSGYPDAGDENIVAPSVRNFIQKPFTKEKLLRKVRELLDS